MPLLMSWLRGSWGVRLDGCPLLWLKTRPGGLLRECCVQKHDRSAHKTSNAIGACVKVRLALAAKEFVL
jgi:hypothetical protein